MTVFAYGTLMFPEVWQAVTGGMSRPIPARAAGFAVYRLAGAVYPGMVRAGTGEEAVGVLHMAVTESELVSLDLFEGDDYRRELIDVVTDDGQTHAAFAYVVPAERQAMLSDERWQAEEFIARGDLQRFLARYGGFSRLLSD